MPLFVAQKLDVVASLEHRARHFRNEPWIVTSSCCFGCVFGCYMEIHGCIMLHLRTSSLKITHDFSRAQAWCWLFSQSSLSEVETASSLRNPGRWALKWESHRTKWGIFQCLPEGLRSDHRRNCATGRVCFPSEGAIVSWRCASDVPGMKCVKCKDLEGDCA